MLEGFLYAYTSLVALLVAVAVLAGLLGWLIGSRRSTRQVRPETGAAAFAPSPVPTVTAPVVPAAPPAEEPVDPAAPPAEEPELAHVQAELSRLETGAIAAWDKVVPRLEERIGELERENAHLVDELQSVSEQLRVRLARTAPTRGGGQVS